jgi:hypothetical protein
MTNPAVTFDLLREACNLVRNVNGNNDWLDTIRVQDDWITEGLPFDSISCGVTVTIGNSTFGTSWIDTENTTTDPFQQIRDFGFENGLYRDCRDASDFVLGALLFWNEDPRLADLYPHLRPAVEWIWGSYTDSIDSSDSSSVPSDDPPPTESRSVYNSINPSQRASACVCISPSCKCGVPITNFGLDRSAFCRCISPVCACGKMYPFSE